MANISINKHNYNIRRVNELNQEIIKKEKELVNTKGFFNTLEIKAEIRELYKKLNAHGQEVIDYEIENLE